MCQRARQKESTAEYLCHAPFKSYLFCVIPETFNVSI